jgi:hypothetical protein
MVETILLPLELSTHLKNTMPLQKENPDSKHELLCWLG